jgi:uncharacterized membrane protein YozB (DUF420 family)
MNTQEKSKPGDQVVPRAEAAFDSRGGNFYVAMSLIAFGIVAAGFGPAIADPSGRTAPISLAVALHGMIFTAWLVLFLAQSLLIKAGQVRMHRRLGLVGASLAVLMIVSGYRGAIAMARRGFDLSGDLNSAADPLGFMVFQLGDLLAFGILVALAIVYRRRAESHKRLMLLATVGTLMGAPLTHVIGHYPILQTKAPLILVPLILLYSAHAVYDRITRGRIHPVSLWVAVALFVWANVRAAVIGPSAAWREFAAWLVQ